MVAPSAKQLAEQWLDLDRDPDTRGEIEALLQRNDEAELEARMRPRIAFGTAGLRAQMQAGFARMNCLTVAQASTGLAEFLLSGAVPYAQERGVVIGRDHRHNSAAFANIAASAFAQRGIKVLWLEHVVHTPLVPFTIKTLNAAAGVMITASHNPAADNGYKVWWSNACQIIPPVDSQISDSISRHLQSSFWDADLRFESALVQDVLAHTEQAYYASVKQLVAPETLESIDPCVFTPLHGVGRNYFVRLIEQMSGRGDVESFLPAVLQQANPDPDFSTVKFPNPEEKGALDLAFRTAEDWGIGAIIAFDPDADRFSTAERLPDGIWFQFTGNQVGVLLASYVLELPAWSSKAARRSLAMLSTTVSTSMLRKMAKEEGFHHVETLTGFKWLGNVAKSLEFEGFSVPYAFEEALGYMFTQIGFDKDGVCASAIWLAAREKWRKAGLTPFQKLQTLYEKYGYFADANSYLISPTAAVTNAVFANIRRSGIPSHVGGKRVTAYRDLTTGVDTSTPTGKPELPVDASSQMITCELEGSTRFTVRASGTEPKIKIYVESVADTFDKAQSRAVQARRELIHCWFEPETWQLKEPE